MEERKVPPWRASASFVLLVIMAERANGSLSALFVFGDSTVDCGTNNYINTTRDFRGNFPPYGQDFFGKPTGRFSNGRVIVDFIAQYANKPLIPPYLEPNADHSHGANFGSGGAGVLVETNEGMVLDLQKQLTHFLKHKMAMTEQHGQSFADGHFSDAVYIISIGSNDYLGGYYGNPKQRERYTAETFVSAVVAGILEGVMTMYRAGARKIVVLGLGPMGCLPAFRALDETGSCLAPLSALGAAHNNAMKEALEKLEFFLPGLRVVQGYVNGDRPCCGAGPCEGRCGIYENHTKRGCEQCGNANDYVWWDPYHPSETVHQQLAEKIWNGTLTYVQPIGVEELFTQRAERSCTDKLDLFAGDPLQQMVSESFIMS